MKLDDKIRVRKLIYLLTGEASVAFELALLYFIQAKRKTAQDKILDTCSRSIYWLKKAGSSIPEYLKQLSPFGQLEELEKVLVLNKTSVGARVGIA